MRRSAPKSTAVPTPWLTADEQRAWRQVVALLMTLPAALESDLQRLTNLTMFEYLVLTNLSESGGHTLRMSALANRANSSLSRLSHVVGRLQRNGLVVKAPCPDDGRVSEVTLTKAGIAKVRSAAPHHVAAVRELVIDPLTPTELLRLAAAASIISDRVAESNRGAPGAGPPPD